MKTLIIALTGGVLLAACLAQVSKPVPKGIRQADQAEGQGERSIPPPSISPRINASQFKRIASNPVELAESVSAEVEQVNRGTLPKDLTEKLKRIEQLVQKPAHGISTISLPCQELTSFRASTLASPLLAHIPIFIIFISHLPETVTLCPLRWRRYSGCLKM